ncbi:MAG: PilZ domain-containing protein [Gemmataceae bacterium]
MRYHCAPATPGKVFLSEDQEYQRAWVENLSINGVGLILDRYVGQHTVLTLRMQKTDNGETVDLVAQVMHIEQRRDGDIYVGCELLQPLTLELLDALLA